MIHAESGCELDLQSSRTGVSAEEQERFLPLCPEFIVEVRSRSDSAVTLRAKMQAWRDNGAELAWMIDPYAATVTIYRPEQLPQQIDRPEWLEGEGPVLGFRLKMERLWAGAEEPAV